MPEIHNTKNPFCLRNIARVPFLILALKSAGVPDPSFVFPALLRSLPQLEQQTSDREDAPSPSFTSQVDFAECFTLSSVNLMAKI